MIASVQGFGGGRISPGRTDCFPFIFGVWNAAEFGLPMPAWSGAEAYDTPEVEDDFRFAERARLILGTRAMQTS